MNEIDKYSSVTWYIDEIKKLIVNKNTLPKNFEKKYREKECIFSNYLVSLGIQLECFSSLVSESIFENFIVASYTDLEKLQTLKYNINDIIPLQFKTIYNKFSKNNINNLILQKSELSVCPYCNENYIINRGSNHTSAQLDHFWNKKNNPIFSICLYNLIPSCYACNHVKGRMPLNISPFNPNIDRNKFKITYSPTSAEFLTNNNSTNIKFITEGDDGEKIMQDIEQLKINSSYMFHNDYIEELLKKAYIYNKSQIKEIFGLFGDIVSSEEELYRLIFGNYIDYENLNSRPLSKLTQDILKELKIIK